MLFADGQSDLGQQSAVFDVHNAADQLVAAADLAEIAAARGQVAALELFGNKAVNFALGHPVVAAGGLGGADFAVVDPLFERGIADAQDAGGFTR